MSNRRHRVFVKSGVTGAVGDAALRAHFAASGRVLDVYIPRDQATRQPRGFAYVSLDSEEAVARATSDPTQEIAGRHIPVGRAEPRPSDAASGFAEKPGRRAAGVIGTSPYRPPPATYHLNGGGGPPSPRPPPLPPVITPLPSPFTPAGGLFRPVQPPLRPAEAFFYASQVAALPVGGVLTDYRTMEQQPPPYGRDFGMGTVGVEGGGGMGGGMGVGMGGGRPKEDFGHRIFVGGVPDDLTDHDLRGHFEKYGPVEDVYFPKDKSSGKRRGFCYVRFSNPYAAEAAAARSPRTIAGRDIGEIKVAQPRPEDSRQGEYGIPPSPMGGGVLGHGGKQLYHVTSPSDSPMASGQGDFGPMRGRDLRAVVRYRPY